MEHEGFVALQVKFAGCMTATISKDNPAEIKAELLALGLSEVEATELLMNVGQRFLAAVGKGPVDPEQGVQNVKEQLGAKEIDEIGPKCGHGVPRIKRKGSRGDFWACCAKDENGTFLWKKKEGCKPIDYKEGLELLKSQG